MTSPAAVGEPVHDRQVVAVGADDGLAEAAETFASMSRSSKKVVAVTIVAARSAGLPDLKMPEPANTPSAPSCIIMRRRRRRGWRCRPR
ncbi:hypothetical protein P9209_15900 [Prescottella defluvii]|nr:hypothetical protein P9209_15900 [Prescottella defluvii]